MVPNVGVLSRATVGHEIDIASEEPARVRRSLEGARPRPRGTAALPDFDSAPDAGRGRDSEAVPRGPDARGVPEGRCCSLASYTCSRSTPWRSYGDGGASRATPCCCRPRTCSRGLDLPFSSAGPILLRDGLLFVRFAETVVAGLAVMAGMSLVKFAAAGAVALSYVPLVAALSLLGTADPVRQRARISSARVNLGPVQPIEAIRLLLALFLAGYFARRWELLRGVRGQSFRRLPVPEWLNLPRAEYILPVLRRRRDGARCSSSSRKISARRCFSLCVPGGLRRGAGTDWHGSLRPCPAGRWILCRLPAADLRDVG